MISLASNVLCLAETTMLSVCASSLSTRGADAARTSRTFEMLSFARGAARAWS